MFCLLSADFCFNITSLASLRVEVDGLDRGTRIIKLESAVSELDQLLKTALDPMDFMCQTLGISSREHLDALLAKTMLEKVPRRGGLAHMRLVEDKMDGAIMTRGTKKIFLNLKFFFFSYSQQTRATSPLCSTLPPSMACPAWLRCCLSAPAPPWRWSCRTRRT